MNQRSRSRAGRGERRVADRHGAAPAGAACGVAAGTVALVVGQVGGLVVPGAVPPLQALGDLVIRWTPIAVTEAAIRAVGHNDKTLLMAAILVVSALASAAAGIAFVRGHRALALRVVAALGVVAMVPALTVDTRAAGPEAVVLATAGLVGAAVLTWLATPLAERSAPPPRTALGANAPAADDVPTLGRRQLLRAGLVLISAATLGETAFRALNRAPQSLARRLGAALPLPAKITPLPIDEFAGVGAASLLTPTADFYRIDTALSPPRVDADRWRLVLSRDGREVRAWTYDELLALSTAQADITIGCISNEIGGDLIGSARWQGVLLVDLLGSVGVTAAGRVTGTSVDGFVASFPGHYAFDGRAAMVAVGMNGRPLPVLHGFPARLVVPGLYGYSSATKWLATLDVSDRTDLPGYWADRGWTPAVPVHITSRIDSPHQHASLSAGRHSVAGIAWAPTRGIAAVEVQIDDGLWQPARLSAATTGSLWRQFLLDWSATPGTHRLQVRATDLDGRRQDAHRRGVFPSGATGLHTVTVRVQ